MAENVTGWGLVERVIDAALTEHLRDKAAGVYGLTDVATIAAALRKAGLVTEYPAEPDFREHLARFIAIGAARTDTPRYRAWRSMPEDMRRPYYDQAEGILALIERWQSGTPSRVGPQVGPRHTVEHMPMRGSTVETWLKVQREQYRATDGGIRTAWWALDAALDDYREHADTGTPLDQQVQGPHPEED